MEKVVYILGAGFSAPLGLPVMSNFLVKSRDLYFQDQYKYEHFKGVFSLIKNMSVGKNYYKMDLFNIEEILSVIEMEGGLMGKKLAKKFVDYIIDVICAFTPDQADPHLPANYHEFLFGKQTSWKMYGHFLMSVMNLKVNYLREKAGGSVNNQYLTSKQDSNFRYSFITLNYDLVIEKVVEYINRHYPPIEGGVAITINRASGEYDRSWNSLNLAKLHGSVDDRKIVPPTWSKSLQTDIRKEWSRAYQILKDANYIRFVGYSMPSSDSYVQYLLKSASIISLHLKGIDAVCLDPEGSVRQRFDKFVEFNDKRFCSISTQDYLGAIKVHQIEGAERFHRDARFESVESSHEVAFSVDR